MTQDKALRWLNDRIDLKILRGEYDDEYRRLCAEHLRHVRPILEKQKITC